MRGALNMTTETKDALGPILLQQDFFYTVKLESNTDEHFHVPLVRVVYILVLK